MPAREQAYLGVLIDDLVSKGVTEPYRMFTSRAEYRLQLREDHADLRLTETGRNLGLVDDRRWEAFSRKCELVSRETTRLAALRLPVPSGETGEKVAPTRSALELLRRPGVGYDDVAAREALKDSVVPRETLRREFGRLLADQAIDQIETATRYAGYVAKQQSDVERAARAESTLIPADFDIDAIRALSFDVRQVFKSRRPATIGAAARLPGVTPAAISLLLVHVKKYRPAAEHGAPSEPLRVDA